MDIYSTQSSTFMYNNFHNILLIQSKRKVVQDVQRIELRRT